MGKKPYLWIDFVVVLPFVNVSRKPIPCKQSNKKHIACMISIIAIISIRHIQICNQMQFFGNVDHFEHLVKFFFMSLKRSIKVTQFRICSVVACHHICRNPTLRQVWGWDSHSQKWELGVLRDSQKLRARLQGSKHLALRCFLYHWKGLEM
jgi:hypothetical protein